MTKDGQASAARLADRGDDWDRSWQVGRPLDMHEDYRQAMHDRDRFQRERDYWREQASRKAC